MKIINLKNIAERYNNKINFNVSKIELEKNVDISSRIEVITDFHDEVNFIFLDEKNFEKVVIEKNTSDLHLKPQELLIIKTIKKPLIILGNENLILKFINDDILDIYEVDKYNNMIMLLEDFLEFV